MSVLIKGMEIPKNCTICRFCVPEADPENGEMCMATGRYMPPCSTDRLENCPLVEVPSPHGRLIDGEKAKEELRRAEALTRAFGYHNVIETISEVPTIIEAEEGEPHEQN